MLQERRVFISTYGTTCTVGVHWFTVFKIVSIFKNNDPALIDSKEALVVGCFLLWGLFVLCSFFKYSVFVAHPQIEIGIFDERNIRN